MFPHRNQSVFEWLTQQPIKRQDFELEICNNFYEKRCEMGTFQLSSSLVKSFNTQRYVFIFHIQVFKNYNPGKLIFFHSILIFPRSFYEITKLLHSNLI